MFIVAQELADILDRLCYSPSLGKSRYIDCITASSDCIGECAFCRFIEENFMILMKKRSLGHTHTLSLFTKRKVFELQCENEFQLTSLLISICANNIFYWKWKGKAAPMKIEWRGLSSCFRASKSFFFILDFVKMKINRW